jgi:hypothetical protein
MPYTTRSKNLDLYRMLRGGHAFTAKRLKSITNAAYLSEMATGNRPIDDPTAREIEVALELPTCWLDQDNESMLYLSRHDFALHATVQALEPAIRRTVHDLVNHLATPRR